jgi:hypothetical protein
MFLRNVGKLRGLRTLEIVVFRVDAVRISTIIQDEENCRRNKSEGEAKKKQT